MRILPLFSICTLAVIISPAALGQLTIDATGPIREQVRQPSSGSGGGIGRQIPIQVTVSALGGWNEKGEIEVDFTLTNIGNRNVNIPISPNPGDLEPADANYTLMVLTLRIMPKINPGGIFPGGADLFGSPTIPGTLVNLGPGSSVRVITRVGLPRPTYSENDLVPLIAGAMMNNETIRTVHGQLVEESQEIGSAYSQPVTSESLLK